MAAGRACLGFGLCSCGLVLACTAAASLPLQSRDSSPAFPGRSETRVDDATIIVADPRHPAIRIELRASEAASGEGMDRLYRKLVKSSRQVEASRVVVENGRVFLRRAEMSKLARAP